MAKLRTVHRCSACGSTSPTWLGRCPGCGEWNTLDEQHERSGPAAGLGDGASFDGTRLSPAIAPAHRALAITDVDVSGWAPRPTGLGELDRVLGGGLVPGSVTLLGGEPGAGKSTLLLQALGALAGSGARCLLVTAEESAQQVRDRAVRLGAITPGLHLAAETSLPHVLGHVEDLEPDVLAVDSIQTVHEPALGSAPGTVTQVRECAQRLVHEAKARGLAVVLVGHVTKDGSLAGPRVLEHVVDTVLAVEGDRHHTLRLLRTVKHRYGSTAELGILEMTGSGLVEVADPSGLLLADRRPGTSGSIVVPTLEGHRPFLVEMQALTVRTTLPQPRRTAQGLDSGRLGLVLAVLERHAEAKVAGHDVYASVVGGVRVAEPGADLAAAVAVASSLSERPVPADVVAFGEIGLGGELRQVTQPDRRLREAARLGFLRAIVPESTPDPPPGIVTIRAGTVCDAVDFALDRAWDDPR